MTETTHNCPDCTGTFKPNGLDWDHGKTFCVFLCSGCGATVEYPAEVVEYPDQTDPPRWPPTGTIWVRVDC